MKIMILKIWLLHIMDYCESGIYLMTLEQHEYIYKWIQFIFIIFGFILFILGPVIGTMVFLYDFVSVLILIYKDYKRIKNEFKY